MTTAVLAVAAALGYVVGSLSPAMLVARRRGVDLRAVGSGNPGATNAGRALGRSVGVAVAVADVVKALLPTVLFGLLDHRAGLAAGLAAVLGHISSPLLRGRGGKGVAAAAGAVLGAHPWWGLVVLATWLLVVAASRWVALASVTAALAVPAVSLAVGQDRVWAAVLAAVVVLRHRRNLSRLSTGSRSSTAGPAGRDSGQGAP